MKRARAEAGRPELGRTEKLRLTFTPEELETLLRRMGQSGSYRNLRDWARDVLLGRD